MFVRLERGDKIMVCSDGVHDNFDAELLGKSPSQVDSSLVDVSWKDLDFEKSNELKSQFSSQKLREFFLCSENLQQVGEKILEHCLEVTKPSREWMAQNKNGSLPSDYTKFPGKMDHTTLLLLSAGLFEDLPLNVEKVNTWIEKNDLSNAPPNMIGTVSPFSFKDSLTASNIPISATVGHTKNELIVYVQLLSGTELECKAESDRLHLTIKFDSKLEKEIQKIVGENPISFGFNEFQNDSQRTLILPEGLTIDPSSKRSIFDRSDGIVTLRFEKENIKNTFF